MVTIFDEDTPLELIKAIRPDVLVKGGDYRPDEVVGRTEVEEAGGRLVLVPLAEGHSTTTVLRRASERAVTPHRNESAHAPHLTRIPATKPAAIEPGKMG